jgi:hypothetical protein
MCCLYGSYLSCDVHNRLSSIDLVCIPCLFFGIRQPMSFACLACCLIKLVIMPLFVSQVLPASVSFFFLFVSQHPWANVVFELISSWGCTLGYVTLVYKVPFLPSCLTLRIYGWLEERLNSLIKRILQTATLDKNQFILEEDLISTISGYYLQA